MPGGAPLKRASTRPCKYGPRDEDGRCPKKPSTKRSTSSSSGSKSSSKPSKKPCKYGPRTADGLCPKKPKAAKKEKTPTVRDYKSVDSAAKQAGEVLRSKKATSSQKKEAVKVLGTAVAVESAKKAGENVYREAKVAVKKAAKKESVRQAAKGAAKTAAKVGAAGTGAGVILYAGGKALTANREREAKKWAASQLAATRKRLAPQKLTTEQANALYDQYYRHALKQAPKNSYSGK